MATRIPKQAWLAAAMAGLLTVGAGPRAVAQAAAAGPAEVSEAAIINFSFDQVEIGTFVRLVGEITGKRFVLGEGVAGKITVVSPLVARRDVYPLFVSILESAGFSVAEEGGLCRVVALPKRDTVMAPVIGVDDSTPAEGVVTKVFRLNHVPVADLRKVVEPLVGGGRGGAVGTVEETNHLLITDTAETIRRIGRIIEEIDKPGLARVTEVMTLEHAGADEIAKLLNEAMSDSEGRLPLSEADLRAEQLRQRLPAVPGARSTTRRQVVVVASPHANSLILAGTPAQIEDLKRLIQQMDVEAPSGRGRLNAVFLKYLSADEAAKSLGALLAKSEAQGVGGANRPRISIEASVANNALLVDAMPGDFDGIRKLIEQVDRAPEQVHISVLIAEISASEGLEVGVEMAAIPLPTAGGTVIQGASSLAQSTADSLMNTIQSGIFPGGLTVGLAHGRVGADGATVVDRPGVINIDAMRRSGQFNVLSETALEAQNHKEASVSIVNEIPILKSTIQGGSGTSRDVIQNIDRVDVGIKLKLTPHIIPGGEVQMVLSPSIEAVTDAGPSGTDFAPTIAKREVSTTVTVPDGATIVIAGLTREDRTRVVAKVPILGSIPILGFLFRHKVDKMEKTNLLIFVTPHVLGRKTQSEDILETWQKKTGVVHPDGP